MAFFLAVVLPLASAQAGFRILPGDRVVLDCPAEPFLSVTLTVSEHGAVSLPTVGWVQLAGLSVEEAQDSIRRALSAKWIYAPPLDLRLAPSVVGPIRFRGAIQMSGEVAPRPQFRLRDLAALARLMESADPERVQIQSSTGEAMVVDLEGSGADRELRPGDRVFFPQADRPNEVTVLGAVARPGVVAFRRGLTVRLALAAAGGLTEEADTARIEVERRRAIAQTVNLDAGGDAELQRGDVLRISRAEPRGFVRVTGRILQAVPQVIRARLSLGEAVRRAAPLEDARLDRVVLIRRVAGRDQRSFHDVSAIWAGKIADVPLQPGDQIELERKIPDRVRPATVPAGVRR